MGLPIRVSRLTDVEGCDLKAEDHRGELYQIELDCAVKDARGDMTMGVYLCRHHLRTLRHVLVDV